MKKKEEEITFLVYIMKLIVKENNESRMAIVDTYVQYVYLYYEQQKHVLYCTVSTVMSCFEPKKLLRTVSLLAITI